MKPKDEWKTVWALILCGIIGCLWLGTLSNNKISDEEREPLCPAPKLECRK